MGRYKLGITGLLHCEAERPLTGLELWLDDFLEHRTSTTSEQLFGFMDYCLFKSDLIARCSRFTSLGVNSLGTFFLFKVTEVL